MLEYISNLSCVEQVLLIWLLVMILAGCIILYEIGGAVGE